MTSFPRMTQSRGVMATVLVSWTILSLYYLNIVPFNLLKHYEYYTQKMIQSDSLLKDYKDFLIKTPGCTIPNYTKTYIFEEVKTGGISCGNRAVFIERVSNDKIRFRINKKLLNMRYKKKEIKCSYRFASRSTTSGKEDTELIFTPYKPFKHGTAVVLEQEVITVSCRLEKGKIKSASIYEDAYMVLKKVQGLTKNEEERGTRWNVLLVGMDTMSRGRVRSSMPKTAKYLQHNDWLDYRGYQKIAYNTFPNLMALLTGMNISRVYSECPRKGMSFCNQHIMWTKFKEAGYVTAYGEDNLNLPDTFSRYEGFKIPPTHHYMRPLFLTNETVVKTIVCTKKMSSGRHLIDFAADFATSYRNENFFGLFWINSYSHNTNNAPTGIDEHMVELFKKLNSTLDNTFIIFTSDHGMRFGKSRRVIEGYYEERLPMLYIKLPTKFKKQYPKQIDNALVNQHRLVTPYDLHATLCDILKYSNKSINIKKPEACPKCTGIFNEISTQRTCQDAMVEEKWCSCRHLKAVNLSSYGAKLSLKLCVAHVQNISRSVETKNCTKCQNITLKKVLRIHSYVHKDYVNRVYYVVAFVMTPGNVAYEVNLYLEGGKFQILEPTDTISGYNSFGTCANSKAFVGFCVCKKIPNCMS